MYKIFHLNKGAETNMIKEKCISAPLLGELFLLILLLQLKIVAVALIGWFFYTFPDKKKIKSKICKCEAKVVRITDVIHQYLS